MANDQHIFVKGWNGKMFSGSFGNPEFLKKAQFTIAKGHDSTLPFLIVGDQPIVCCNGGPFPESEL